MALGQWASVRVLTDGFLDYITSDGGEVADLLPCQATGELADVRPLDFKLTHYQNLNLAASPAIESVKVLNYRFTAREAAASCGRRVEIR